MTNLLPEDGEIAASPYLILNRLSTPVSKEYTLFQPVVCIAVQGTKRLVLGGETYKYDPGHYLISTVELPIMYALADVSEEHPYLGIRVLLDPSLTASVLMEHGGKIKKTNSALRAMNVGPIDADMIDAALRLVRLLEDPRKMEAIAPLIIKEMTFLLLEAGHEPRLSHLLTNGHAHQILKAVAHMRRSFASPLRVEDLARDLGMSVSGFHHQFKSVTTMSPVQFQKHLRLQEARRLMLSENLDAASAGFLVGYDNPSYFNLAYKNFFGAPPLRDIEELRGNLKTH
jgi:AraC-like DNA-binding protein